MITLVDDLPVYYESYGEGRPVVFLPGWGNANSEGRDIHEPAFENHSGWRRIYIDPPGTGNTPSRDWIKDQDDMLDVLARVTDDLAGGEPFALAGTSAGGLHARGIIHRDPTRILGLLLRVPGVVAARDARTLPEYRAMPAAFEAARQEKQTRYYLPAEEQADLDFLGTIQRNGYGLSVEPKARLEAPTLIVTGRQDTITGYADAWPLLDDYPRATYAVLDRADHDLPIENEALYRTLVSDWLDRMEEMAKHPGA